MKLGEIVLKHESDDFERMVEKFIEVNQHNTAMLIEAFYEITEAMVGRMLNEMDKRDKNEEDS